MSEHSEVFKSFMPAAFELAHLTQTVSTGIENIIYWLIAQTNLLTFYHTSPEHSRCIQIKAEGAFGEGITGKHADRIEALCETGSADLFTQLAMDIETYGNAFLQLSRDRQRIVDLSRLPAITMYRHVNLQDFVQIIYLPNGQEKITHFDKGEVLHLRPPCPFGTYYALPTWIGAGGMLELMQAAVSWNQKFFTNHALPEYAIITKGTPLTQEQREAAKTFFQHEYQGIKNSHRTLYLHMGEAEADIEFKQLTVPVKDADFLKLLDAGRDRIPIAHGVPPRMLGIMTAGQLGGGSEVTGQLFTFEKLTLAPRRRRMRDLLRPLLKELAIAVNEVEFRGIDLTPPDMDNANITSWAQDGIISNDEARSLLQIDSKQGLSKGQLLDLLKQL
jgi:HK97 family phage portal protein